MAIYKPSSLYSAMANWLLPWLFCGLVVPSSMPATPRRDLQFRGKLDPRATVTSRSEHSCLAAFPHPSNHRMQPAVCMKLPCMSLPCFLVFAPSVPAMWLASGLSIPCLPSAGRVGTLPGVHVCTPPPCLHLGVRPQSLMAFWPQGTKGSSRRCASFL